MTILVFTYRRSRSSREPSGFDLGHVQVTLGERTTTSEGRTPDQSCMIYIMAADLLDAARELLVNDKRKSMEIIGADSSFRVRFQRRQGSDISIEVAGERLGTVTPMELVQAAIDAGNRLLHEFPSLDGESAYKDLEGAIGQAESAVKAFGKSHEKGQR